MDGGAIPQQRRRATVKSTGVRGLRRRRQKDVAACARLLRVVHYESHYPEELLDAPRAWLCDDDVIDAWVVERQDEILGHVAISRVGHDSTSRYRWREMTGREATELAAVSRLFVRPKARGLGLGSALLEAAVTEVRAQGLSPVLQVVDGHADAVRLFEEAAGGCCRWTSAARGPSTCACAATRAAGDAACGSGLTDCSSSAMRTVSECPRYEVEQRSLPRSARSSPCRSG